MVKQMLSCFGPVKIYPMINDCPIKRLTSMENYLKMRQLFFLVVFVLIQSSPASADRKINLAEYSSAYYDSIRAIVNDTTFEHYSIRAYRLQPNEKISIDGKLVEAAWHAAEHKSDLLEKEPFPLVQMSEKTEFAVMYDDNNLYVGVWSWDSEPEKIVRQINPRGTASPGNINLFLDTYHDHRTGYKFNISPSGVQSDELRYDDVKRDTNWNGVWYSAATIDDKGWYAEVKIPFFNLRFRDLPEHTWGFNVMRNISKDGSRGQWKPHLPEWHRWTHMSTNGHIEGIRGIKQGRSFELRPYALAGLSQIAPESPANQFNTGLDLRFSPSPNITADITVNPDFAQVDADVTDINLTRYPTRFRELRPFFTERTNIFNSPLELFYSRRIGAKGNIRGGAKVTGKTENGYEYGALGVVTGTSYLSTLNSEQALQEEAGFGVFRMKKDLFSASSLGFLGAVKESGSTYNHIAGIDGSFVFFQQYLLDLQFAKSFTETNHSNNAGYHVNFARTGDAFGFTGYIRGIDPFFEINRIGYLRKEANRGLNEFLTQWRLSPRLNKHNVRIIEFNIDVGRSTDLFTDDYLDRWMADNPNSTPFHKFGQISREQEIRLLSNGDREFHNWMHGESLSIQFMNERILSAAFSQFRTTEVTESYVGQLWNFSYLSRPMTKGARFPITLAFTAGDFYNFDWKYVGFVQNIAATISGRLSSRLISSMEAEQSTTFDPAKRRDGEYWRFSSYTTLMFTKDFYVRLQLQGKFGTTFYESEEAFNEYLASVLLSWEYLPGCFFYIAYNEGRFDDKSPFQSKYFEFNDRTFLLKASYRFNI